MRALIIFNPQAGGGKAKKHFNTLIRLFEKYGIRVLVEHTKYPGYATELLSNYHLSEFDAIIAAGGDGTFFEVLNGYMQNKETQNIPLGIIPIGTGNSLAREISEKKLSIENSIRIIGEQKTIAIDIAKVQNSKAEFYYANMLGMGLVNDITKVAMKWKKFGKLSYSLSVFYNVIRLKSSPMQINYNSKEQLLDNIFILISNSRYSAGNYLMAPKAKLNDGLLDLIIINKLSRYNLLKTFPKIFSGQHIDTKFVDYVQVDEISIKTKSKMDLSPDGELFGELPVKITCVPKAIKLLVK